MPGFGHDYWCTKCVDIAEEKDRCQKCRMHAGGRRAYESLYAERDARIRLGVLEALTDLPIRETGPIESL